AAVRSSWWRGSKPPQPARASDAHATMRALGGFMLRTVWLALLLVPGVAFAGPKVPDALLSSLPADARSAWTADDAELQAVEKEIGAAQGELEAAKAARGALKETAAAEKGDVKTAKQGVDTAKSEGKSAVQTEKEKLEAAKAAVETAKLAVKDAEEL